MSKSIAKIHILMKNYRKKLRHIWEEYSFIEYYAPYLHENIKNGTLPPYEFEPFLNNRQLRKTTKRTSLSALDQVLKNSIKNRVLLDSIGIFEDYICNLAEIVYTDYPEKLKNNNKGQTEKEEQKYINFIMDSDTKEEMISKIIEEKLRSIFYGNPLDIFEKDKVKLSFGKYFTDNYQHVLDEYKEITATRNVIIHNNGKVDRKYLREVVGTSYNLRNRIILERQYLKKTLSILEGLAAISSKLVVENIYNGIPRGKLENSIKSFKNGVGKTV